MGKGRGGWNHEEKSSHEGKLKEASTNSTNLFHEWHEEELKSWNHRRNRRKIIRSFHK
jgi:hypothetical protein